MRVPNRSTFLQFQSFNTFYFLHKKPNLMARPNPDFFFFIGKGIVFYINDAFPYRYINKGMDKAKRPGRRRELSRSLLQGKPDTFVFILSRPHLPKSLGKGKV
jgi:hypothetical protein